MKTSKPASQASAQEECGVWLDTVQLKGKAKQKRLTRPISKLLNPLAERGGYSLAVALNFTQTKIQMPNTKQSSISTFFAPQRRVLNKISISEEPNTDPVDSSSSSSTSTTCASTTSTPVVSGTKRKRDMDPEASDLLYNTEERQVKTAHIDLGGEGAGHGWESESVTESEAPVWQEHYEASHTPPLNTDHESEEEQSEEETSLPERKRRLTETSSLAAETHCLGQECSQEPSIACSSPPYSQELNDPSEMKRYDRITHDSESEFYLTNQKHPTAKMVSDSGPVFLESLQSEEGFALWMGVEGRTSTQKSFKHLHSSQMDDEKENGGSSSSKSPNKRSSLSPLGPLSNRKWTEPKIALSQKHIPKQLWKKAEEESLDSQHKWTKPNISPLKKRKPQQPCREVEEDSLAMLFTQDSEGFRVIAHRGLQARSPLKDHTNLSMGVVKRTSAYKSLVEDEEEEMLFTQDSQGNMVIKH
uniref:uncharacterized protein n=1 Tax=Centroberyx gerrardi TaxID=166262 RepID=UPI003AB03792